MSKDVYIRTVSPEFLRDVPEAAGKFLADWTAEDPDAFYVVLIGSREDARRFSDIHLFQFGPVEAAGDGSAG